MEYTWSTNNKANTRSACEIAIRCRCITCGLLIAESNKSDAQRNRLLGNLDDRYPNETKYHLNAKLM